MVYQQGDNDPALLQLDPVVLQGTREEETTMDRQS